MKQLNQLKLNSLILYMLTFLYGYMNYQATQNGVIILSDEFGATLPDKDRNIWFLMNICTMFGYLMYSRVQPNIKPLIAASILALALQNISVQTFIISIIVTMLIMGAIMAIVHYKVSIEIEEALRGRCVGFALSGAVLVHYFFSGLTQSQMIAFQVINLVLIGFFLIRDVETPQVIKSERVPEPSKTKLMILVSSIAALMGLTDGAEFSYFDGDVNVYFGDVRLTYFVGLILAGFLADFKERKFLLPTAITLLTARIVGLIIFQDAATYQFNVVINYLCGSVSIITIIITFMDLGARSEQPMLWSGMGRVVQLLVTSFCAIIGAYLWNEISWNALLTAYILILIIPLTLSYANKPSNSTINSVLATPQLQAIVQSQYEEAPTIPAQVNQTHKGNNQAEPQAKYSFTEREAEILNAILEGLSIKDIALTYNIKERTVKYHISNILRKTETRNQRELLLKITKNR